LLNGWQSFSFSGLLSNAEAKPISKLQRLSGAFHRGATLPASLKAAVDLKYAGDMFGVVRLDRVQGADTTIAALSGAGAGANEAMADEADLSDGCYVVLAGFLSQRKGFGAFAVHNTPGRISLVSDIGVSLQPGLVVETDWLLLETEEAEVPSARHKGVGRDGGWWRFWLRGRKGGLDQQGLPTTEEAVLASRRKALGEVQGPDARCATVMQRYFEACATHQLVGASKPPPVGWCSWYCHGPKISESS
jgi:hypothetical protein